MPRFIEPRFSLRVFLHKSSSIFSGPDYGEAKVSCLHTAVVMNHYEIGKYLIEQGLDPNLTTSRGHTPLHYAASWGHADFAYLLITHGQFPTLILAAFT